MSGTLHTVANDGDNEDLFHGVWAESGAIQHLPKIGDPGPQNIFNEFVQYFNCSNVPDAQVLQCIRDLNSTALQRIVGISGPAFWELTADGTFLKDLPIQSLINGNVANVPIVTGVYYVRFTFVCI